MKLTKILEEVLGENDGPCHIIVVLDGSESKKLLLLTEGRWEDSDVGGYKVRVDKPKFDFGKLHAHIAKEKHINTKAKQVSWNNDGTRHDKKTFNNNFNGMETAKGIARKALGLSDDFQLECISDQNKGSLMLESIGDLPSNCFLYVFSTSNKQIL
jgi:Family of unknown function (DUF6367)